MSHYLTYVILPDIPKSVDHLYGMVAEIMAPYNEDLNEYTDDGDSHPDNCGKWDYWRFGGRWGGWFTVSDPSDGFAMPGGDWDSPPTIDGLDATRKSNIVGLPMSPFTIVAEGVWKAKIDWSDYPDSKVSDDEWDAWWERFYAGLGPDVWIAVVDYHS